MITITVKNNTEILREAKNYLHLRNIVKPDTTIIFKALLYQHYYFSRSHILTK